MEGCRKHRGCARDGSPAYSTKSASEVQEKAGVGDARVASVWGQNFLTFFSFLPLSVLKRHTC